MIRLGVCTGPDKIGQAAELGFEFIECGFAWLSSLTDEEYDKVLAQVQAAPIRVEACNGMLPGDLKVVGDNVDEQAIRALVFNALHQPGFIVQSIAASDLPDDLVVITTVVATHMSSNIDIESSIETVTTPEVLGVKWDAEQITAVD